MGRLTDSQLSTIRRSCSVSALGIPITISSAAQVVAIAPMSSVAPTTSTPCTSVPRLNGSSSTMATGTYPMRERSIWCTSDCPASPAPITSTRRRSVACRTTKDSYARRYTTHTPPVAYPLKTHSSRTTARDTEGSPAKPPVNSRNSPDPTVVAHRSRRKS